MDDKIPPVDPLMTADMMDALESDRFRQFLDHVPFGVAVSELSPAEQIIYANRQFERLAGQPMASLKGMGWSVLPAVGDGDITLSDAIIEDRDYIGVFTFETDGDALAVDAWVNVIHDDEGEPAFRLIALSPSAGRPDAELTDFEKQIREKDLQLREIQHRVANNLQLITALIRIEARNVDGKGPVEQFSRLSGRVEALGLLYRSLSPEGKPQTVDLGIYLSEIASAVMHAHAVEGIHFDLQVDTWPVSIDVALPTGLVVNELLTNSLKHAFSSREGGTISVRSLVDADGCQVTVFDDGVGLPSGMEWPLKGKLSNLMVQSLRQNARARVEFKSLPGAGMRVTMFFARADVAIP